MTDVAKDITDDDTEFTELVDANVPRVDLVGRPANGSPGFLLMKQEAQAGLMDPDVIRDLIGKSEPEPTDQPAEQVTMTGSPAAIAKFIHQAAQRRDQVGKADESTASINDLPDSDFAYIEPGGKKDESGKTTPRSLRHFPIHDAAHVRNALARAPQSPFGDKAMPKIRAAADKLGVEVSKAMGDDDLDTTTVLAEPDGNAPGNPTQPGSPAWEAIDAATACKWTSLLARARAAVGLLADRELLEAAAGDGDDADNAWDLEDACCAIDFAISVLAPFAVSEQAEADKGEEFLAFGKAVEGFDAGALDTIESLGQVRKAGRVLSAANEAAIRAAADSLQKVLASLPQAPTADDSGLPVAKTANEETDMPTPTLTENVTAESGQEPAMGTKEPDPKPVAGQAVTVVGKADGEGKPPMVAVYDAKGKLVGIVDPGEITPISGADASDNGDDDTATDGEPVAAPETPDLQPQPAAEAGQPADAVDDGVAKTEQSTDKPTDNDEKIDTNSDMFKSSLRDVVKAVLDEHSAAQNDVVTKQTSAILELAETVETLKGQVKVLEEQPAEPRVFTNGAVPPAAQLRGQNAGAPPVDLAKAAELKKQLYRGETSGDQNQAYNDLQKLAIAQLSEIHRGRAAQ